MGQNAKDWLESNKNWIVLEGFPQVFQNVPLICLKFSANFAECIELPLKSLDLGLDWQRNSSHLSFITPIDRFHLETTLK